MTQTVKPATHTLVTVGVLVLIAMLASSSATPAQDAKASPINTDLFLGRWTGTWLDTRTQASGEVDLVVTRLVDNFFNLRVKLTNSRYPEWGATGEVKDGVLTVHEPTLDMKFSLGRSNNRMNALRKFIGRYLPHPLSLEPVEFCRIEDCPGFLHAFDREVLDEFL